jgi:hypothetical protein
MIYDPRDWYWIVAGDTSKAWSSASAGYVDIDDVAYAAWLGAGGGPTRIGSLAELAEVFAVQYPGGMLLTYAADLRWRKETGGITVGGVPILTDDRAQLKVAGARIGADADPEFTTVWDGADGGSYPIDAATVIAISNAVLAHVNECFKTYSTIKGDIDAGTITTREDIDTAFA